MEGLQLETARSKKRPIELKKGFGSLGWGEESTNSSFGVQNPNRIISAKEVRQHNDLSNQGWMVLDGVVYDVTNYGPHHPGGLLDLTKAIGDDGTYLFEEFHHWVNPNGFIARYRVGFLKGTAAAKDKRPRNQIRVNRKSLQRLDCTRKLHRHWVPIVLKSYEEVAKFTYRFSFQLNDPSNSIKLSMLSDKICPFHVMIRMKFGNKYIVRPLTPLNVTAAIPTWLKPEQNLDDQELHIVVKLYEGGHLSKAVKDITLGSELHCAFTFSHLKLNDKSMVIEGMRGKRKYQGAFQSLGFIVAGTGILPAMQVIQYLLRKDALGDASTASDEPPSEAGNAPVSDPVPFIYVVYSCTTESDFLYLPWLQALEKKQLIKLYLIASAPEAPGKFSGYVGKFSSAFLKKHPDCLPTPKSTGCDDATAEDRNIRILLCGPPGYEDYGPKDNRRHKFIRRILLKGGWDPASIESF